MLSEIKLLKNKILIIVIAANFLWLSTVITVFAAQCTPDDSCASCPNKGAQMKCKFDSLANASDLMNSNLRQSPELTEVQRNGLLKAKDRSDREKGRLESDDFHVMAKKKGVDCQFVELKGSGNGDGVCQPELGEQCVEVIADGIGNDDGTCSPMKGKNREVCAQICDEEAILQSEENVDMDTADEIESSYEDMTSHIQEINGNLAAKASVFSTASYSADSQNPCVFDPKPRRTSNSEYKAVKWAAMGSRSGADFLERFCDQTFTSLFFTWTLGGACILAETAASVANEWLNILDTKEAILDAEVIDATLSCASQTMTSAGNSADRIQAVQNKVNSLKAKQAIILQLIKTPPGKRPNYPML